MLSERQLRDRVSEYVKGVVSLADFEDWFARESWNIHKSDDLAAQRLAYSVELRLSEHSSGHLPEQELREELNQLVSSPSWILIRKVVAVQSSASMYPVRLQRLVFRSADIKPAMASESPVRR